MTLPAWIDDMAEELGTARLRGTTGRPDAVARLAGAIAASQDRELFLAIFADFAARRLDAWHREHQNTAPVPAVSHVQMDLFPDLKPRLYIRVGVTKPVMTMTAHDWDAAREMVLNRTKHAIEGAEADRKNFEAAYERVRPLLSGDATTSDVARELRGQFPLEGIA